jgi:N6-L-threonylcarbamoyladenine synthase
MIILGIETSCDDTGIAVIKAKKEPVPAKSLRDSGVNFEILSNVVSSQIKTHAPFGGVVPNLAAREHLKNIEPCLKMALKEANKKMPEIDLIAVTYGPGLIPSLLIGVNFAKALAYKYKKSIIGINHIEAHIIAAFSSEISNFEFRISNFPVVALVVSGGHTQLVLVKKPESYKIIGETRDDAAGECFDKVAKLLNLGYPGGPAISREAEKWKPETRNPKSEISLPRPMISHKNYDFSFSGLKTAVLYLTQSQKSNLKNQNFIQELCCEAQQAIIDVLINKTIRAAKEYRVKTIILAGGVAANSELRRQFELKIKNEKLKTTFLVPPMKLCTDNGAMIAITAYFNQKKVKSSNWKTIKADANLRLS